MAEEQLHAFRVCSKCNLSKPETDFGYTRKVSGRSVLRAQCRACYNERRRANFAIPDVYAAKRAKRIRYDALPEVRNRRREIRSDPEVRQRERAATAKYRSDPINAAKIAASRAKSRAEPLAKAKTLFCAIKLRSQRKSLPFDLTEDWLFPRVLAGRCELTGIEFDFGPPPNGWRYNPKSPSVDQISAGEGYLKANCRVILTSLNNALSQYGDAHFEQVAIAFLEQRGKSVT